MFKNLAFSLNNLLLSLIALLLSHVLSESREVELFRIPLNQLKFPLPRSSSSTLPDDKKVFVKLPKKKGFRPVFVTTHLLEAPYLYLDEMSKIRSIETEAMRNFLTTELQKEEDKKKKEEEKLDQYSFTQKVGSAARSAFFTIPIPPIDRSQFFTRTDGEIRFSAEIFEHCNDHLLVDGHPRCIYFYISMYDDNNDQVRHQDCLKLYRLMIRHPPPSTQWVILQLNGVETYEWSEAKGKSTLIEHDKWESGTRKNKKPTQ